VALFRARNPLSGAGLAPSPNQGAYIFTQKTDRIIGPKFASSAANRHAGKALGKCRLYLSAVPRRRGKAPALPSGLAAAPAR
jgi:hypothetical protein